MFVYFIICSQPTAHEYPQSILINIPGTNGSSGLYMSSVRGNLFPNESTSMAVVNKRTVIVYLLNLKQFIPIHNTYHWNELMCAIPLARRLWSLSDLACSNKWLVNPLFCKFVIEFANRACGIFQWCHTLGWKNRRKTGSSLWLGRFRNDD